MSVDLCLTISAAVGLLGHWQRVTWTGSRSCSAVRSHGRSPSWSRPLIKPIVVRLGTRCGCRWRSSGVQRCTVIKRHRHIARHLVVHLAFYVYPAQIRTILDLTFHRLLRWIIGQHSPMKRVGQSIRRLDSRSAVVITWRCQPYHRLVAV